MTNHRLAAVTVPLVTAFDHRGKPDPDALITLLSHLAENRITTLMLFGSNGEGVAVRRRDIGWYTRAIRCRWQELTHGSGTVFVAVSGPSTDATVRRARTAAGAGANALVVNAPYYFRHNDDELLAHFARVDELGTPWIAYNIPRYTGNPLTASLMQDLAALPNCIGVKDSSGDLQLLSTVASLHGAGPDARAERFGVSQGAEPALVDGLRSGAVGITPGVANLAPGICVELFEAVRSGDLDRAERCQEGVDALTQIHTVRPGIAATKAALRLLQLADTWPSAPFLPFDEAEISQLRRVLERTRDIHHRDLDHQA